jgi:hypothetical protein
MYNWKALFEQYEMLKREKKLVQQQKRERALKNTEVNIFITSCKNAVHAALNTVPSSK